MRSIILIASGLIASDGLQLRSPVSMRVGGGYQRGRISRAVTPLIRRFSAAADSAVVCDSDPEKCDWECNDDASCDLVPADGGQGARKKNRLVVRMDDRWVDLTGWRNAHPAGAHWIDVYDKNDATEVMHAFHSDVAHEMLARLPPARPEDVPRDAPAVTPHTAAFRALRAKLMAEGWFKRNPLMEAATLSGWALTFGGAVAAAQAGKFGLAALLLGVSNTSAGWIAHDYIHGRGRWPSLMRGFGELVGGMSATWWSDKHNMHHALTNVVGVDEDLMVDPALWLWAPDAKDDKPVRKWQHLYWWAPYSLLFAIWRIDSVKVALNRKLWGEAGRLGLHYAALFAIFPAAPVLLPAVFVSGLLTATIVTVSHVSDDLYFDGPHQVDYVESQLRSTRDFECSNPFFEYLSGGMNYQVEHHLFPTMPRYKYPALVPIVKQFAADHGLPYKVDGDAAILKRTVNHLRDVAKLPQAPGAASSRSDEWVTPAALR